MADGDNNILRFSDLRYYDGKIKEYINGRSGSSTITIDNILSNSSKNPVQNKVINNALNTKFDINDNVEVIIDNDDTIPFYDVSTTEKKKITLTNLKTVLQSYFNNLYNKYILPTASTSVLGGVKIDGTSIIIDDNGTISTDGTYIKIQHENNLLVSSNERDYNVTIDITNGSDSNTSWTYDATTGLITVNGSLDPEEYTEIKICHFDGNEDYFLNYLKDKKVTLCGIPNISDLDEYLDIEIYIDQYNNPQHYRKINKNNSIIITEIEENEYDYDVYVKISNTITGNALSGTITLNDLIICPCLTFIQIPMIIGDELKLNGNVLDVLSKNSNLSELDDVSIISPSDNDILKYNATTEKWENGEGGSNTNVLNYDETLDVLGLPPNPIYKFRELIPVMTSNTTPSGAASASSANTSSSIVYEAYRAFDSNVSTRWTSAVNTTNQWIQYKFDNPKVVSKIKILAGAPNIQPTYRDMPFVLRGSNDGTLFTDLKTGDILAADNLTDKYIFLDNEDSYLYYRLQFTGYNVVYSGNWTCIVEIKMYEKYLA